MKYILLFVVVFSFLDAKIYRDSSKNIVIDDKQRLMWQDSSDNVNVLKNHSEAHEYCDKLSFAGFSDWRLPYIEEYETIVNKSNSKTNIDFAFRFNLRDQYWAYKSHWRTFWFYADYMYFVSGTPYFDNRDKLKYLRCVREY